MFYQNTNEKNRQRWLTKTLSRIPAGATILDAGAGELRNKSLCRHLKYISQDFCQYEGKGDGTGLQTGRWDNSQIDLVCDITSIPVPDSEYDAILCSEVLEHVPDPVAALNELTRVLKPGGALILTAPFASLVHFAPYHFCTGFSRYWYEHHLVKRGLRIEELVPNGDWFSYCSQEISRLGGTARRYNDWSWPVGYLLGICCSAYFKFRGGRKADDLACFGWHCVAIKME